MSNVIGNSLRIMGNTQSVWQPKYAITSSIAKHLMDIEAARVVVENTPLPLAVQAELTKKARIRATHYSTRIEGNRLTRILPPERAPRIYPMCILVDLAIATPPLTQGCTGDQRLTTRKAVGEYLARSRTPRETSGLTRLQMASSKITKMSGLSS